VEESDMGEAGRSRRIVVLAPMPIELSPVVRRLKLTKSADGTRRGTVDGTEVIAVLGGIGPAAAAETTRRMIEAHHPDHVFVVGVAGGVGAAVKIGHLIVPDEVTDLDTGEQFHASPFGDAQPSGRLITSAELIVDKAIMDGHAGDGIDAVDMETSAVARVSGEHGLPWTAFRGISDHYADELMDGSTIGLMHEDGKPNLAAVAKYVAKRPANIATLTKLAKGTSAATKVATAAFASALHADAVAHRA
jgi:nucleoside phosphorylase